MTERNLPPYLQTVLGVKKCSACDQVFPKDAKPSLSQAFATHVREVHKKEEPKDRAKNAEGAE